MCVWCVFGGTLCFCYYLADVYHGEHSLLHALDGKEFVATMEIQSACKDVGAGEAFERELCSVCATTDGYHLGKAACLFDGALGYVDDVRLVHQLGVHIVVSVLHLGEEGASTIFLIHPLAHVQDETLAHLEHLGVVVANDVCESGLLHTALHLV